MREKLIGRWRLVEYQAVSQDQNVLHPMGEDPIGVLDYSADGKVSVHIMRLAADGYFAYYGDYTVDEDAATVTHHLEMSSDPALVGASNLRYVSLEGEGTGTRLVLSGPMSIDGKPRTISVVWERDAV
jgi:hypothetical protein